MIVRETGKIRQKIMLTGTITNYMDLQDFPFDWDDIVIQSKQNWFPRRYFYFIFSAPSHAHQQGHGVRGYIVILRLLVVVTVDYSWTKVLLQKSASVLKPRWVWWTGKWAFPRTSTTCSIEPPTVSEFFSLLFSD